MLGDIRQAKNVYIVTGYTDMRKGIRSLVPYVMQNFKMDPYESGLFLFCGKKCDRLKALLWEPDGFVLLYKVLDVTSGRGMRKRSRNGHGSSSHLSIAILRSSVKLLKLVRQTTPMRYCTESRTHVWR